MVLFHILWRISLASPLILLLMLAAVPTWRRAGNTAILGGLILGALGLIGGYIGPLVWMPDANQGPLFGIFITGPLGFAVGAGFGLWLGLRRRPRSDSVSVSDQSSSTSVVP